MKLLPLKSDSSIHLPNIKRKIRAERGERVKLKHNIEHQEKEWSSTMHYCDVTNSSGRSSPCPKATTYLHPPLSVHYKSLVIGLLLCRQVLLSGVALWAAWRSPCGDPSHLVLVAQVCSPRASAFVSFEGTSCRESRRSADLPTCHKPSSKAQNAGQCSIGDTKSIWNSLAPSLRQSHSPFTSLSELSVAEDVSPQLAFPNCSQPYQSPCHMSLGLKFAVMTSQNSSRKVSIINLSA